MHTNHSFLCTKGQGPKLKKCPILKKSGSIHKKARGKKFDPKKILFDKALFLILIIRGIAPLFFAFFTREKFPK